MNANIFLKLLCDKDILHGKNGLPINGEKYCLIVPETERGQFCSFSFFLDD